MKVLLIGANGTLGKAVAAELGARHQVVAAGRNSGEVRLDLREPASFQSILSSVGNIDALVSAAGNVAFGPLLELNEAQWQLSLEDKLMGQVRLALAAVPFLNDGGSITLTGGILADHPIRYGAAASMVNAGLQGFVLGAALELPRGIRLNLVSPTVLTESMPAYGPYFRGFEPVSAARAALGFARSVDGAETGKVYRVF